MRHSSFADKLTLSEIHPLFLHDHIRSIVKQINHLFTEQLVWQKAELTQEISRRLQYGDDSRNPTFKFIEDAIDILVELRLLEQKNGKLKRRWIINPEFVLNSVAGIDSGIPGFDFLLNGGLMVTGSSPTILIEGPPGAGKTVLALQLAGSLAKQGFIAIFLSMEMQILALKETMSFLGLEPLRENLFDMIETGDLSQELLQEAVTKSQKCKRGTFFLHVVPEKGEFMDFSSAKDNLEKFLPFLSEKRSRAICVIDPLNAVVPPDISRQQLFDFLGKFQHPNVISVWTQEDSREEFGEHVSSTLQEFLVDMVIRVGYRYRDDSSFQSSFKERYIEIVKSRIQYHMRGKHPFSITPEGLMVYPSVQSLLSIWQRRILDQQPVSITDPFGIEELDSYFGEDMVSGSCTLLFGSPGTHKFPLGLYFLAQGLSARPADYVLIISLMADERELLREVKAYHIKEVLTHNRTRLKENVLILSIPPDYYSPERFIHLVRQKIGEVERNGKKVSRCLFNNLDQAAANSPMVRTEPLFVPALLTLFRQKGITSLFIDVGPTEPDLSQPKSPMKNGVFDNFIFTHLYGGYDEEVIGIRIGHTGPCDAERKPKRLKRAPGKDGAELLICDLPRAMFKPTQNSPGNNNG